MQPDDGDCYADPAWGAVYGEAMEAMSSRLKTVLVGLVPAVVLLGGCSSSNSSSGGGQPLTRATVQQIVEGCMQENFDLLSGAYSVSTSELDLAIEAVAAECVVPKHPSMECVYGTSGQVVCGDVASDQGVTLARYFAEEQARRYLEGP